MVTQIPEMGTYYSLLGKWGAFFIAIADLVGLAVNHIIKNGFNIISKTNDIYIAFLIHTRYIPDPEQLNQQRFKCAAQMREPLYIYMA
ncbi:hypothetical protein myaer87_21170 [Microcystis aeruginosa NIES-87]|uniref:hypothetical protein n=1 Tax=Microcystis TaxID=1125 RepID=UPI000CB0F3B8|nr:MULTISPECIES: hypothetical protein [Microcystis]MCA2717280.1 hypothetical protein [Microcystis sp. M169S2]WNF13446.1 hypothetical protein RKE53_15135 [Microcystis aeruginosa NRERC-214]GBE74890.1 hypothetical protein myaer87_21170 [Microcystis aeruginosa NIES-87]